MLCMTMAITAAAQTDEIDSTNVLSEESRAQQEAAALDIINRFTEGTMQVEVELSLARTKSGLDRYTYSATSDVLTVKASSAVAACRGFYDYVKAKYAGFCTWSGKRFQKPTKMECSEVSLTTQFRDHQYFNVVTYGYTMPYWDEERWDQEIDWMALHGIDMPLMLVGAEQIYREVFYEMGLSKAEVDEWEVGPAHLPWFRMGNLAGNSFDGPLGEEWNTKQRALAHHLLDRMRALGMKPVCPAFGGFVPKAFTKHHSGTTEATGWSWVPTAYRNYRLNPGSAAFVEVGRRFIQRWEEEYGVGKYYLSDSFNEMTIPSSTTTLTQYGDSIFKSISEGSANPEAVWVTQGWTFVYQSGQWGSTKFDALTQNIPDNRFMVLYMSPEYGPSKCWEVYNGFNGKEWCYTMLPNMGGKSFWTGNFSNYASTYLTNLYNSASKGNVTGYGMTPEGVENNEMLYELITDAGWTKANGTINLDTWFKQYAFNRYGKYISEEIAFHSTLRNTVYNKYIDHPRFGWQMGGNITGTGNASLADAFYTAVEKLFSKVEKLQSVNTPLLENELIEIASLYTCGRIESLSAQILKTTDKTEATRLIGELDNLMMDLDAALELHPLYSLERWENMAQKMGDSEETKVRNARNARRIVTCWYGDHTSDEPVQDYAARIWSGLVRDFYRPRLINTLMLKAGIISSFNHITFENEFVNSAPTLSAARTVSGDHIEFLARLVNNAKNFGTGQAEPLSEILPSTDSENHWYVVRSANEEHTDKVLTATGDYAALLANTDIRDGYQAWRFIQTGEDTYRIENRWGENIAVVGGEVKTNYAHTHTGITVQWTTDDSHRFALLPADADSSTPALLRGDEAVTLGTALQGETLVPDAHWTLEDMPPALVPEAKSEDYTRYIRRLTGYAQTELYGKVGQPTSEEALNEAVDALYKEAQNIDHKTFDTFLAQWATIWQELIVQSESETVNRLTGLIASAHQLVNPSQASESEAAQALVTAYQQAEKAVADGLTDAQATEASEALDAAIIAYYEAVGGSSIDPDIPEAEAVFPINFDIDTENSRSDRTLGYISIVPNGASEQKAEPLNNKAYQDLTRSSFSVTAGDSFVPRIGYNGNWMHGYFYIDLDGDGTLSYNANQVSQEGKELLAYSFWSGSTASDDTGYNSAGTKLTGNSRNTVSNGIITMPSVTAPSEAGTYYARYKVDWNSADPAGRVGANGSASASDNGILNNGGFIIDIKLNVTQPDAITSVQSDTRSDIAYDLQGRSIPIEQLTPSQPPHIYIVNGKKVLR